MMQPGPIRLGVNIDHVATIRNARGGRHPDPLRAAQIAAEAGADGITAHLREDRRHIVDDDIFRLSKEIHLPLNMECAATSEMLEIALRIRPHAVCLVPEKREEVTTEGGLDVAGQHNHLRPFASRLRDAGIRVSLFINPDLRQIEAAGQAGADIVELHAGAYCEAINEGNLAAAQAEIGLHRRAAEMAAAQGLEVHAGHGIAFDTVSAFAAIPQVVELNIGHFLIGEAVFIGLHEAVRQMRSLMNGARG
jgi:pyridoxine 5-phosphate synthase